MALYLIDGNSYVYRAYYAIRGLTSPSGVPTNAVYGFTRMLLKIIKDRKPDGVIVSFDTPHPTKRHELYEKYKAQRPETPGDLVSQVPLVRRVLEALRIKTVEVQGYEADDVIATIAEDASLKGMDVYIVSSDKDMLQLVDGRVKVYDPIKDVVLDRGYVENRFGVPPERVVEFMALVGDSVDNIPGAKGIGEKTAKELLSSFPSLEDLMSHPEKIGKARLRKMVEEGSEDILLSRKLAEIDRRVPIEMEAGDYRMAEPDWETLLGVFKDLGFTSLMNEVKMEPRQQMSYEAVLDAGRLREITGLVSGEFALDTETTGKDPMADSLVGFSLCMRPTEAYYVPLSHDYDGAPRQMDRGTALGLLRPLVEDPRVQKIGHNLKFDMLVLRAEGLKTAGRLLDTMVASYLLDPLRSDRSLEGLALEHLMRKKTPYKEVAGTGGFQSVDLRRATPYAAEDAELALELKDKLFDRLRDEGLEDLYLEVEMPLIQVLADMEAAGMKIDSSRLEDMGRELERELDALKTRIFFLAGEEFNINSPKQLARVLFEGLGLRPGRKKKTGYSTDMGVLEELAKTHDLPLEILNWRSLSKLKNTYVDVLPRLVNRKTGRLHTSFNQTVTATGRLSSSAPNLQNIPVRGDWGRRIREAFVADEGNVIVSADYSQIELRILAHMSRDEALLGAFESDVDVHRRTAAEIFGVAEAGVTPEMRRVAKTVNFGVIYGMSPFGLSEALDIPRADAESYIERYFSKHPGVNAYMTHTVEQARMLGYVSTLSGRKRPVPELRSKNTNTRMLGERVALNSPIQGTAADIIKRAMISIHRRPETSGLGIRMLLQVHDELVFEVPVENVDKASALVRECMERAGGLDIPARVDIGAGGNWAEAHS